MTDYPGRFFFLQMPIRCKDSAISPPAVIGFSLNDFKSLFLDGFCVLCIPAFVERSGAEARRSQDRLEGKDEARQVLEMRKRKDITKWGPQTPQQDYEHITRSNPKCRGCSSQSAKSVKNRSPVGTC